MPSSIQTGIKELLFSGNFIPAFNFLFLAFKHLEYIDLSNNRIKFIHQIIFIRLNNLKTLDLSNNELHKMFSNINRSVYLRESNKFYQIYNMFFTIIPAFNPFYLSRSSVVLNVINLSSNKLSQIPNNFLLQILN